MIDSTLSTRNSHIHARQNRGTSAHLLDALLVAGLFGTAAANGATGPSIYMQPQSQTVTIWHEATFSVLAGGTEPLSYQWSRSGTVIPGATSNTYTTPPVAPSEDGATFTVIVSNAAGSVASQPAKLAVVALRAAPAITTQPIDQTVLAGQTARFTVVATGTAPLMYQWRRNGIEIRFASESSYTTPPASAADNGAQFTVIVSNRYGRVTSRAAVLTVNAPAMAPTITTQPQSVTVTAGQTATFSVVASGTAPLSYQWKKNSTAISGATAASYTTPAAATTDSGSTFTVTVSNTAGSVTSNAATLTVNAAAVAPTITTQPQSVTVTAGQTATFSVVASGTAPLGYQWKKNSTAISGATAASYTTPATATTDSGSTFTVTVSNTAGSVTSSAARLTVNAASPAPQTITFGNPGTQTVGTPLALSATASSGLTVSFASTTTSICTVSGTTATFSAAGTCTIQATQAGNSTYAAAAPVSQSFTVKSKTSGGPLAIITTSCPGGTQLATYAGCTIVASGGTPPYTYSLSTDVTDYPPLPEGMSLNETTGVISSSLIGGQGTYIPEFVVTDSTGAKASMDIGFAINGSNAFLASIFPSTSIFHHRVDAATTGLPVDTSPAAPMYSGYLSETIKPFFGDEYANFPNGIPAIEVPYNQPDVTVTTTLYQSYFTSGPIPSYAPVEGTANAVSTGGDMHVLVYLEAGDGNNPALYEMWQGIYEGGPWTDSSNALWPNVSSNALTPQGQGTSDAAGLPVAPLLANADEVIGTGTPTAPNGTVQHPIRFTLNHMLNYWVWPATQTAGVGSCTAAGGGSIPVESQISQSSPPTSCTMSGAAGEIYRLKASVATPSCAETSPQAAIIITGFRNYGIILADNGDSGGLIGTPDARWNDNDLSCLTSLTLSDFEPVNVSSLMVSATSGATSH